MQRTSSISGAFAYEKYKFFVWYFTVSQLKFGNNSYKQIKQEL